MKRGKSKILYLCIFMFTGILFIVHGQNIEQVAKAKPVSITGGFNLNGTAYGQSGGNARRDPFGFQVGANLNFNFFGVIDASFSAYMTSENKTFNRPSYRQFGISPSYKWATVHAGWRNIEFSPYTLSGTTFFGIGVELQPETFPLRGKAVYGRFAKKTVQGDTLSSYISDPVYNRWGYGLMLSVGPVKNAVDLILFRAADKYDELLMLSDSIPVTPQENFLIGLTTRQQITKYVSLNIQYAVSAYTDDIRMGKREFESYTYLNNLGRLYTRYSSGHSTALDAQLNVQLDAMSLGLAYNRISPDYRSMGTLFLNNDVEDIRVNASMALFNRKISLSGSVGVQHDNLDSKQSTENRRIISSFNGSYQILENLSTNLTYSNFNATTEPSRVLVQDSIKYAQISQNFSGGINYSLGKDAWNHIFNLTMSRQIVNTINTDFTAIERSGTKMNNGNIAYRANYKPADLGASLSLMVSNYLIDSLSNVNFGPQMSVDKGFFDKKLRSSLSYSLQCSSSENASAGYVHVFRLTASYSHGKHHSFSFNTNLMMRSTQPTGKERGKSKELMATLSYNYKL